MFSTFLSKFLPSVLSFLCFGLVAQATESSREAPPIFSSVLLQPELENELKASLWKFSIGPAAAFYQGTYGGRVAAGNTALALNTTLTTSLPVHAPLWVGADLAFYFWAPTVRASSSAPTGVHLLPTALYRFTESFSRDIFPFVGIALGPHLFFAEVGGPALFFELLLRGGLEWAVSKEISFVFEPKLGVLDSYFVALPQTTLLMNF